MVAGHEWSSLFQFFVLYGASGTLECEKLCLSQPTIWPDFSWLDLTKDWRFCQNQNRLVAATEVCQALVILWDRSIEQAVDLDGKRGVSARDTAF
ncbi:hypothetical protein [Parasphingorhabdus sp.]|uniref:hypothetical protein n=1 Tax=Parasphingorhabdus sp. TaxID=2709688 RepID=UPI003266E10C